MALHQSRSQAGVGEVQRVLQHLLREGVSIRDLGTVLESIGDRAAITRDPALLAEYARQSLARNITARLRRWGATEVLPGSSLTTDEELRQWVRDNAWGHHACGTCAMGPDVSANAVLDSKGKRWDATTLGQQLATDIFKTRTPGLRLG